MTTNKQRWRLPVRLRTSSLTRIRVAGGELAIIDRSSPVLEG